MYFKREVLSSVRKPPQNNRKFPKGAWNKTAIRNSIFSTPTLNLTTDQVSNEQKYWGLSKHKSKKVEAIKPSGTVILPFLKGNTEKKRWLEHQRPVSQIISTVTINL